MEETLAVKWIESSIHVQSWRKTAWCKYEMLKKRI
jgi:hypothetical protein